MKTTLFLSIIILLVILSSCCKFIDQRQFTKKEKILANSIESFGFKLKPGYSAKVTKSEFILHTPGGKEFRMAADSVCGASCADRGSTAGCITSCNEYGDCWCVGSVCEDLSCFPNILKGF